MEFEFAMRVERRKEGQTYMQSDIGHPTGQQTEARVQEQRHAQKLPVGSQAVQNSLWSLLSRSL